MVGIRPGRLGEHCIYAHHPASRPCGRAASRRYRAPLLPRSGPANRRPRVRHRLLAISFSPRRGRLRPGTDVPAAGERIEEVLAVGNVVVEQILSGPDVEPEDYLQDQDEWITVLAGAALMEVGGERVDLVAGDWVLLPAGVPHRLVEVEAGTNWLAVHVHPPQPPS